MPSVRPVRLYKPSGPDHVAIVSAEPSYGHVGSFLISVARGPRKGKLVKPALYGPFPAGEVEAHMTSLANGLRAEGFAAPGLHAMLSSLASPVAKVRARAALRLGWMREGQAVDPLLQALAGASDDLSALVDALGAIGDGRAIPAVRNEAERKLLSRRRSGVEALRALDDAEGLAAARARAIERLPPALRPLLADPEALLAAGTALAGKDQGLAIDTMYEIATPATVAVARQMLASVPIHRPFLWRYAKSVLKRSMLRHDAAMFGWLTYLVEKRGRLSPGGTAEVKSGYDGVTRKTAIFRARTRRYLSRLSWRYLRRLAVHRPELYTAAAAEAIVHYQAADGQKPKGLAGAFARAYLLHRVLWGQSDRFHFASQSMTFRFRSAAAVTPPPGREESHPDLWDAYPRPYLRLLAASQLQVVREFALRGLKRAPAVLAQAEAEQVAALVGSDYEPAVLLGLEELRRRFRADDPDWTLLRLSLQSDRPVLKQLGLDWLEATAALWTTSAARMVEFLGVTDAVVRDAVVRLAMAALATSDATLRADLASRIVAILHLPETSEGGHAGYGLVACEALVAEIGAILSLAETTALIADGSLAAQAVAAAVLATHGEWAAALGVPRLVALAEHEVAALRRAGHTLLRSQLGVLRVDPTPLFTLAESAWPDTRAFAVALLRQDVDLAAIGPEAVLGLLESNQQEAQSLGRELVTRAEGPGRSLDPVELIGRLAEHPQRRMRQFALELLQIHAPAIDRLPAPEQFFKKALFDLAPDRQTKRAVLAMLGATALGDEGQARIAARVLSEVVATRTVEDFEAALAALVRIHVAFPTIPMPVKLLAWGAA